MTSLDEHANGPWRTIRYLGVCAGLYLGQASSLGDEVGNHTQRGGERVVAERQIFYPATGARLLATKLLDESTGMIRELVVDARTNTLVDYVDAQEAAVLSWRATYGALHPELLAYLRTVTPIANIRVGVGYLDPAQAEEVQEALLDEGVTILARRRGVFEVSTNAGVLDRLQFVHGIDVIRLLPQRQLLAVDNAKDLGQPALAASHQIGVGTGFVVAVWEPEACIKRSHPDFQSVHWLPRPGSTSCDPRGGHFGGTFGHSTQVASAIAADRGGDDTVGLFRSKLVDIPDTLGDDTIVDAMWNLNPMIVNASFTITIFDGWRIDEEVYARRSFVFNGAGNSRGTGYAQCWAYNALCVGGYDKSGTVGDYEDDSLWSGTTYGNADDGREVPQIVGPATALKLARYQGSGYEAGVGTSFATPAVAGLAGLLLSSHPFVVGTRPALLRAVLMASAQAHPIHDPNGGKRVPDFSDDYDDRVGVGAPNGARADAIVTNRQYFYDASFEQDDLGAHGTISASPNDRVRVVMAWDQCPGYSNLQRELNVDFDMVVERKATHLGEPLERHMNLSYADNWEVVEFSTPLGGEYSVKISAPRWSSCPAEDGKRRARLALAWSTEHVEGAGEIIRP